MRTIIAGGRGFSDYTRLQVEMQSFSSAISSTITVISGGAEGADKLGERWAIEEELNFKRFPADWSAHGKAAGPIRNKEMAEYSDALVAFWDGESAGTRNMISTAIKMGLLVKVIRYEE